jgi:hypothetical protein
MLYKELNAAKLRIALDEIEPPIWRRLVVPLNWRLDQPHLAIQAAFNWWNFHLHEFCIGGLRYGDPDVEDVAFEDSPRLFDEREVTLRDFGRDPSVKFVYTYDFGDNWRHIVESRSGWPSKTRPVSPHVWTAPERDRRQTWAAFSVSKPFSKSCPIRSTPSTPR